MQNSLPTSSTPTSSLNCSMAWSLPNTQIRAPLWISIVSGAVFMVPSRNIANTVQSLGRGRCMTTRPTI